MRSYCHWDSPRTCVYMTGTEGFRPTWSGNELKYSLRFWQAVLYHPKDHHSFSRTYLYKSISDCPKGFRNEHSKIVCCSKWICYRDDLDVSNDLRGPWHGRINDSRNFVEYWRIWKSGRFYGDIFTAIFILLSVVTKYKTLYIPARHFDDLNREDSIPTFRDLISIWRPQL